MKLLLSWIFDHIATDWKTLNLKELVACFNQTTAEIEKITPRIFEHELFTLGLVTAWNDQYIVVESSEYNQEYRLPLRTGLMHVGALAILKKHNTTWQWATLTDFHAEKDGYLPEVFVAPADRAGEWKQQIERQDYIIEIENKAITHRPDLWSHRGIAREMAAILKVPLVAQEELIVHKLLCEYARNAPATDDMPFSFEIKDIRVCNRLAGIYISDIEQRPSLLHIAYRLAGINSRPITMLVDFTNYVMFDIGQPLHAFDAHALTTKHIIAGHMPDASLTLLDDQTITLTADDIVISDGIKPLSLAGIMGGKDTALQPTTHAVVLESAHFDGATIRKSVMRFKKRTEASARFEKNPDPFQNTDALMRYLKLLDDAQVSYHASRCITSLGINPQERVLEITEEAISKKLGVPVAQECVIHTLSRLGFTVYVASDMRTYIINIPAFRSSKDIAIPEDIIEEIGRFIAISPEQYILPYKQTVPYDSRALFTIRTIKKLFAYGLRFHEVYNYALYDAEFLREIKYEPIDIVSVVNPVSEHWQQLVTSLIPHLLKNVQQNSTLYDEMRFFEWARTWHKHEQQTLSERKVLAGVIAHTKKVVDFYTAKAILETVFTALALPVRWVKVAPYKNNPWCHTHQTAALFYQEHCIGYAGKLEPQLSYILKFDAFLFELDGDFLHTYTAPQKIYRPISKYPTVSLDISVLVPLSVTVDAVRTALIQADKRIYEVQLVDLYEKPEWQNQKSLTLRFTIEDHHQTLTKDEIERVMAHVTAQLEQLGGNIR